MNSTAAYDSDGGADSDLSFCSEDEEQVIEISSHSRILISPRKVRTSVWGDKSQRSRSKRSSASNRKGSRAQHHQDVSPPRVPYSSAKAQKALQSGWTSSPRKTLSSNQPVKSNNRGGISDSESGGSIVSEREDSSDDSDDLFGDEFESPVHRSTSRTKCRSGMKRATQRSSKQPATALDDSMQSLGSPTTPGKEMEELKATLKKLARHEDSESNLILQKEPNISSATVLREYLTAATALGGLNALSGEQIPPSEYPGQKTRHNSFHPPRSSLYMPAAPMRAKSNSFREKGSDNPLGQNSPMDVTDMSGSERISFNKKLFSAPPPPFGSSGRYGAKFALPQKKSIASGGGIGRGEAQGSRAVLSALKALQDKIGRLEEERATLMQQLSDAKLSARKREAELASSEKKFTYELGQTKESARAAYDALRCDREELKLQLVKSEERRKAMQLELQRFQELTKTLSEKADDLQSQLLISEASRARLKAEMKESENNHNRVESELQKELTQVCQDQQAAVERIELLEAQFQRESSNHAESRERLKDSEQTVASVSQVNEKLVVKVMEATEAANQATKKIKKLQQQLRPSTLLRPTAASRASAAAVSQAASRRATNSIATQGSVSASPARTLKKKKTSAGTAAPSTTKKPKKAKSANNMTLLREANLGKEIPFLLGNSVQPSFSIIGNIQDALRRCDTTYVMPTLLSGAATTPGSTPSHRQHVASKDHSLKHGSGEANGPEIDDNTVQQQPSSPEAECGAQTAESVSATPKSTASGLRRSTKHKPPAIKVPTASPKSLVSPMQVRHRSIAIDNSSRCPLHLSDRIAVRLVNCCHQTQIMEDLGAAVEAAEREFKGLNKRYKDVVAQMEVNNRRGVSGSANHTRASSSTSAQLSQALGPLLDELETKAKQLNLLKQIYQQASNSTINPPRHVVLSPEAVRRKTASLRVLNEYRQLESDSKNKGSGRSAALSCHLGANGFFP